MRRAENRADITGSLRLSPYRFTETNPAKLTGKETFNGAFDLVLQPEL